MTRLDLTLPTLAENLALDEALLDDAQAGGVATLRFWTWPTFAVVVGAGGALEGEVQLDRCAEDGVPVARRSSGGGTVLLGPGCLLYSLVLPMDAELADLNRSYQVISTKLAEALAIPGVAFAGSSDLVLDDRKFSGNSQQRKRTHLLHHGTLLHAFDLTAIDRYVKHPPRMPDYRRDRPHEDFVVNLPLSEGELKNRLIAAWQAKEPRGNWPRNEVIRLATEKYGTGDWLRRK